MNDATLLYRQIHPKHMTDGKANSLAFTPGSEDDGDLSVDDGCQVTAEDSWTRYTSEEGLKSAGVMAVTVKECGSIGRRVKPDPKKCNKAHALIILSDVSPSRAKSLARLLKRYANDRDWQFRPDTYSP